MEICKNIVDEMINFRRWMHQNPELSEDEKHTAEKIHEILTKYHIEHRRNFAGYGMEAVIRGKNAYKTIAAKADIDALPIEEKWESPYLSTNRGIMHACGHDANTAILLGTAIVMKSMEDSLSGNVKFFFEPAEETIGGGRLMVDSGCMEDPKVEAIVGMHVMPYLDTGKIEIKKGCLNANSNEVEITVYGVPGHAAEPETCVDPIVVLAYMITTLQTLVSRNTSPTDSVVLTFGTLQSGTKGNIIPEKAFAKGTLRTLLPAQREYAKKRVYDITKSVAQGFGATVDVKITDSYDALINDAELVDLVIDTAKNTYGPESVVIKEKPSMGAEDFSAYTKSAAGVYFHLGCRKPGEAEVYNLHTATFHLDEDCIEAGMKIQTNVLLQMLEKD